MLLVLLQATGPSWKEMIPKATIFLKHTGFVKETPQEEEEYLVYSGGK